MIGRTTDNAAGMDTLAGVPGDTHRRGIPQRNVDVVKKPNVLFQESELPASEFDRGRWVRIKSTVG